MHMHSTPCDDQANIDNEQGILSHIVPGFLITPNALRLAPTAWWSHRTRMLAVPSPLGDEANEDPVKNDQKGCQ